MGDSQSVPVAFCRKNDDVFMVNRYGHIVNDSTPICKVEEIANGQVSCVYEDGALTVGIHKIDSTSPVVYTYVRPSVTVSCFVRFLASLREHTFAPLDIHVEMNETQEKVFSWKDHKQDKVEILENDIYSIASTSEIYKNMDIHIILIYKNEEEFIQLWYPCEDQRNSFYEKIVMETNL